MFFAVDFSTMCFFKVYFVDFFCLLLFSFWLQKKKYVCDFVVLPAYAYGYILIRNAWYKNSVLLLN